MLSFFTGALDVAYMSISPLVLGHFFNLPLKILSLSSVHKGTLALMSKKSLREHKENKTIRIGVTLGSDAHIVAHNFVQENLADRDVLYINLSPPECVEALNYGMIDYASIWEPYVSIAVKRGAKFAFSDHDLDFEIYCFLVGTKSALRRKSAEILRLVKAHTNGVQELKQDLHKYIPALRSVFSKELSRERHEEIMREGFDWLENDRPNSSNHLNENLNKSFERVYRAHTEIGNIRKSQHFRFDQFIPSLQDHSGLTGGDPLKLGYSDSMTCAPFYVADVAGFFEEHGLEVQSFQKRATDRIIRLSLKFQEDMRLCYELIDRDPELVIQKLGRMNEQIFRGIESKVLHKRSRSISKVISNLRDSSAINQDILSWSDSIRLIRNVATHGSEHINIEQARNAFNILLNILEWYEQEESSLSFQRARCLNCHSLLDPDWKICPICGNRVLKECPECNQSIESGWKACPECGTSLK